MSAAPTPPRLPATRGAASIEPPRLALDVSECCAALGVSWDFWSEHVAPEVSMVRRGRRKLVPVRALEAWLEANAHAIVDTGVSTRTARKVPANRGVRASRAPVNGGR